MNGANLIGASLNRADLNGANLNDADLSSANLNDADLSGVNLKSTDLEILYSQRKIVSKGKLIGWKKLRDEIICKLEIPKNAKRVGGLTGRKCRAEFAIVLDGEGVSKYDKDFNYKIGQTVKPDKFDPNPLIECSSGIHFFITKEEAEKY